MSHCTPCDPGKQQISMPQGGGRRMHENVYLSVLELQRFSG